MRYNESTQKRINTLSRQYLGGMLPAFPATQAAELREILHFHEYRYYVLNQPLISDFEYDRLYKMLESLESQDPELITPDSPTQRVSSDLTAAFPSVPHLTPMLSLENSYDEADLLDFDKQVRKLGGLSPEDPVEYCVEPKFDGGTVVLLFEDDYLVRGATRGNGIEGEEITNNLRAVKSIPIKADFSSKGIKRAELRGEALIRKDLFDQINQKREEEGLQLFANPRNAATGALRVKDHKEIANRKLEAFVYQISVMEDAGGDRTVTAGSTHFQGIEWMHQLGFKVPFDELKVCKNIREVLDFCRYWEAERDKYPYEIDGMVVKVNDLGLQEKCGSTSHHPRWAVAFKFKARQASSVLLTVEFQVGKTGAVTPVAKIEPVPLAGVTISSVSLHNEDFIQSKDIRIGDTVLVERAGDVIPYIVKSMPELRSSTSMPIVFPTNCPSCDSLLVKPADEAVWRCLNLACPAQSIQRIIHHVSKDGMDIDGFGKSYVERFSELGWLKDISDVYRLDYDQISGLEGFGSKSAEKLRQSIDKARLNPIHKLLQSLSIRQLGKRAAKLIADHVEYVMDLADWKEEDFTAIHEVGPILASNIAEFFANPENRAMLRKMEELGVNMRREVKKSSGEIPVQTNAFFAGKKILFTGTLNTMTREEAQDRAEAAGAVNISAVSSKLDILVAGDKAGSKLKKAQEIGSVQVLSEQEFLERLS
jgi:DNA ligase (NAD+)